MQISLHGFNIHGSARMERGTILICIFSIFSIFVPDVPYYNHAAGSQASMIIGKTLALISLRGVVSSQRLHGVVIDTTLLATGSSYGKTPCPHHEGGNHRIVSERRLPQTATIIINHRKQEQRPVLSGLPAELLIIRLVPSSRFFASFSLSQFISTQSSVFEAIAAVKPLIAIRSNICCFSLPFYLSLPSTKYRRVLLLLSTEYRRVLPLPSTKYRRVLLLPSTKYRRVLLLLSTKYRRVLVLLLLQPIKCKPLIDIRSNICCFSLSFYLSLRSTKYRRVLLLLSTKYRRVLLPLSTKYRRVLLLLSTKYRRVLVLLLLLPISTQSSVFEATAAVKPLISTQSSVFEAIAAVKPLIIRLVPSSRFCASFSLSQFISTQSSVFEAIAAVTPLTPTQRYPPVIDSTLCKNFKTPLRAVPDHLHGPG